jgi:2-C-methyl-D-erythritol 4-phosphate cytidylyltransferase
MEQEGEMSKDLRDYVKSEEEINQILTTLNEQRNKAAEPQAMEQRFDKEYPHCGGAFKTSLLAFIRAEIEREKENVIRHINANRGLLPRTLIEHLKQNKHREGKQ